MNRIALTGALLIASLSGCTAMDTPGGSQPGDDTEIVQQAVDTQPTLEEDYAYPGADGLRESGITLKRGDGNILLVDCADNPDLEAEGIQSSFCFSVRGPSAWLTMDLPDLYLIHNEGLLNVGATTERDGQIKPLKLSSRKNAPPGSAPSFTLLELRR